MTSSELGALLRRVDPVAYPELASYSRKEIYGHGDQLSPGGLFLASRMARKLDLRPGDVVLDVGCGFGASSIFLADRYDVDVVALDIGVPAATVAERADAKGYADRIQPLNCDVTKPLPFANKYFDAICCMTCFHYFGANEGFLAHLLRYLKPGKRLSVSDTCFNQEVTGSELPDVYRRVAPGNTFDSWQMETSKYHSPAWWRRLFEDSGIVNVVECVGLEDGPAMWEDKLAYDLERANWDDTKIDQLQWKIDQILYGRDHRPFFTFFLATLEKL